MKKIISIFVLASAIALATGCYDDSSVNSRIDILETRVAALEQLNSDISSLKTIIEGMQNSVCIKSVEPVSNGYRILFSDGESIEIHNGAKGDQGPKGQDGQTGDPGASGEKGSTPVISVKEDNGAFYWTIDGNYLLDEGKNKIPVSGPAPKLKIEDEKWYASYDGGNTWSLLGEAGGSATSFFSNVEVKSGSVVFTLMDGGTFELPIGNGFTLSVAQDVPCIAGIEIGVPYVITGAVDPVVYCVADGDYSSRIEKKNGCEGVVKIQAGDEAGEGQVLVFASNGVKTLVKCIVLSKGVLNVTDALNVAAQGGNFDIDVETNLEYKVITDVPWISIVSVKGSVRNEKIGISVQTNPAGSMQRSGQVIITAPDGSVIKGITVVQKGDGSLTAGKFIYLTFEAQSYDPSGIQGFSIDDAKTSETWITINKTSKKIEIAKNDGIVRSGAVTYAGKYLTIIQNPGKAFLDLSFEKASGDLQTKNTSVQNVGTAKDIEVGPTTYFYAYFANSDANAKPVTIIEDEKLGHKVAQFHNTLTPSSFGGYLWRNSNANTVKSMYDGFTVELFLSFNIDKWSGSKASEGRAFTYKASITDNKGICALSTGIIGNDEGKPVYSTVLNGKRITTEVVAKADYTHFVMCYDKSAQKVLVYINGEVVGESPETRDMSTALPVGMDNSLYPYFSAFSTNVANPWCLGAYMNINYQTSSANWNGNIAVCRVYACTLSASEIAQSNATLNSPLK